MSRKDYSDFPDKIILHESGHIHHRHSLDIIIAQTVAILCWYNPVAWLMRRDLKTLHEYQADRFVLDSGCDRSQYQLFLIAKATGTRFTSITNNLTYSRIRHRISMMNTPVSTNKTYLLRYSTLFSAQHSSH